MTPSITLKKENKMTNRFTGVKLTKKVKFMGLETEINKLTVAQVIKIQSHSKESGDDPEASNLALLAMVIKMGTPELVGINNDDLYEFPIDELTALSNEIMKYSGLVDKSSK